MNELMTVSFEISPQLTQHFSLLHTTSSFKIIFPSSCLYIFLTPHFDRNFDLYSSTFFPIRRFYLSLYSLCHVFLLYEIDVGFFSRRFIGSENNFSYFRNPVCASKFISLDYNLQNYPGVKKKRNALQRLLPRRQRFDIFFMGFDIIFEEQRTIYNGVKVFCENDI